MTWSSMPPLPDIHACSTPGVKMTAPTLSTKPRSTNTLGSRLKSPTTNHGKRSCVTRAPNLANPKRLLPARPSELKP
eukprot:8653928-Pyramimonas_sp.AAC.1